MQADAATAAERLSKPRPTTKQQGSETKPAASPKQRTTAKKPTKNNPGNAGEQPEEGRLNRGNAR